MTPFDQRIPVERAQARKRRHQDMGAFIQPDRPTIVDVLEDRRGALDNSDFFVHRFYTSAKIIP